MTTPTSFSFTFPAYLTCPSSLALEFTRIGINRFNRAQKRIGVSDPLATVMRNSERFGRKRVAVNITFRLVIWPRQS